MSPIPIHKGARCVFLLLFFGSQAGLAQYSVSGTVTDEKGIPLAGCHVHSPHKNAHTETDGRFNLGKLPAGDIRFYISYIGYRPIDTVVSLHRDMTLRFRMEAEATSLDEVVVKHTVAPREGFRKQVVSEEWIAEHYAGSLAKSLEKIPGINSVEIGSGASKPIIRGLGFNRVVVVENGFRHEGQQWGADHGLEIDPLTAEQTEVIKSAGAIEHGSDAIGGVIRINNNQIPEKNTFSGRYIGFGKSANRGITHNVRLTARKDRFFYKLNAGMSDYADFAVPTDTIVYLTIKMPITNRHMKNTAGKDRSLMGQVGYVSDRFQSILTGSSNYMKAGFFPGAHGVPSIARVADDGDSRNIGFPFQRAHHLKLTSDSKWFLEKGDINLLLGWQNNRRQEWSTFHTHYAGQQPPATDPDLELDYDLNTLDGGLRLHHHFSEKHHSLGGVQVQLQENDIGGYNFLLPEYRRNTAGVFASHEYRHTEQLTLSAGLRLDAATMDIFEFYDPLLYEYLINRNYSEAEANGFALRSSEVSRNFSNFSAMAGLVHKPHSHWDYSLSVGAWFRLPTAIELAANGVHHGSFRHEQGDATLNPEKGYTVDMALRFRNNGFTTSISPYLYRFTNYIFLQPSGTFSPLPHGGQIYRYTQSGALLTGVEFSVEKTFVQRLRTLAAFEFLYNRQLTGDRSRDYPLPFSPPVNGFAEVGYVFKDNFSRFRNAEITVNTQFALEQRRTAQNEPPTDGYAIYGGGIKSDVVFGNFRPTVSLEVHNLLAARYFNHTNFYRALEIPEMGRNIQLMIKIPF